MKLSKIEYLLLGVNVLVVAGFGGYFVQQANYEFVAYAGTILLVTVVLFGTLRWTHFSPAIVAGVTLWGVLHMLGGSVQTVDGVLYAYRIVPIFDGGGEFFILKYDQVVHAYLYGVFGLMFLHVLQHILKVRTHTWLVGAIAIFAAAGFSIVNEIVEFIANVTLPETGVGGYHNTVLDLIFNLFGAAIAVVVVLWLQKGR
jgi:putative membrane protein